MTILLAIPAFANNVRISVTPQRGKNKIEVGDKFYLTIEVTNISEAPARPDNLPGAKLAYFDRTSEQSSFSSVNGRTTQSYSATYTATFRAVKEGSFSYGPITVGGVKSNKVNYNIGKEMPRQAGSASASQHGTQDTDDDSKPKYIGKGDNNLFLRANVSSTNVYEQQAIVYTVKLYTTYDAIKFIGATDSPKFDGFVVEESKDISSSLSFETYNGKSYATAIIARYIIFPQMTGALKVTGNNYTIAVDRREYYHDSFFGSMSFSTPLQLNVAPNDLVINVRSLPEPKPADFSGAVGKFSLTSDLKSSDFKSNQAASIVYTLKGTGNIKYVQLPDLSALYPPELEVYTPKTTQSVSVGSSNVSGSVNFDYSFMPLEEGDFRIPDVKLVYFNPESGRYETSVAKGYNIVVGKGAVSDRKDKAHVKFEPMIQSVDMADLKIDNTPIVYKFAYWLWYIVPVLLLAIAYVMVRKYISSHADMASFNSKRADKIARRRLRKAAAAMRRQDSDAFYDELLTALWGYLGDKLKMPTSELMRDNIRQVLSEHGVDEAMTNSFIGMIDEAEFAKYSSASSASKLNEVYDRSATLINGLEKEFKNISSKAK